METSQIEAFVAVVESGGFSRAATMLHLSQPAISRRITLLEQELGTELFERIHNSVIITPAGKAFLPHAQRALAAMNDGLQAVREIKYEAQGTVTLAMVGTLASTALTARLMRFRAAYPQVKVALRTARSTEVSDLVRSCETTLGLRYFPDPDSHLMSEIVDHEQLVLVCSSHSAFAPLTISDPVCLADLREIPWVSFPTNQGTSGEAFARILLEQLHAGGYHDPEIITIDSLTAQKRLIEADFGIGLLPISSIQEELALETLRIVDCPDLKARVPIVVLHRQEGYLSKAAQTLLMELLNPVIDNSVE
jgi:DNA-binding transcriptional LysR family regulator